MAISNEISLRLSSQATPEIIAKLKRLRDAQIAKAKRDVAVLSSWKPFPGPQTMALESQADILFYGGAAGGGKTDLILGAAHMHHQATIIFRRQFPQLKGVRERASTLFRKMGRFNAVDMFWRLADGKTIELGAVQLESDKEKYMGRPHDLKAFDEITHFSESQFRFLIGWTRSTDPGQRCRVICAGNPPTSAEGDWVIQYWAPWLDKQHPNPAQPGELRWFVTDPKTGKDREVPNGDELSVENPDGTFDMVKPKSRTFIASKVEDNPYLMASGYKATLQSLPEPLRSKMLKGDFGAGQDDHEWQVIPTAWVVAAQARWQPEPAWVQTALGVDVARGGRDQTIITARHGPWFAHPLTYPGQSTPDGWVVAGLVVNAMQGNPEVHIDVIGVGTSPYDALRQQSINVFAMNASEGSDELDAAGQLGFVNKRAEWLWRLREALDPNTGDMLAIPPDRELLADLTAARWKLTMRGIQIESKDDIKARIGRSPDKGDSLVYAHANPHTTPELVFGSLPRK